MKIKIVAETLWEKPYYYGISEEETKEIQDQIKERHEKNIIYSSFWYLHGELEELVGYDKATILNMEEIPHITKNCYFNGDKEYFDVVCVKDGIYDVEILGIDKPCVAYFWITDMDYIPNQRGLVCFKDNKEACEYALKKYNEKSQLL